jgi:cation transport ATPase
MGRHSAPDQDEPDDDAATLTLIRDSEPTTGRHATLDPDELATVVLAAPAQPEVEAAQPEVEAAQPEVEAAQPEVEAAQPEVEAAQPEVEAESTAEAEETTDAEPAAEAETPKPDKRDRKAARSESNTRADLRMLRHNRALRLQCLLVVVIAFGAYTAVMLGVHDTSETYLRWIWIPIVLSGVLVGACLDLAHRRAARQSASADLDGGEKAAEPSPDA